MPSNEDCLQLMEHLPRVRAMAVLDMATAISTALAPTYAGVKGLLLEAGYSEDYAEKTAAAIDEENTK